jgi:ABC-2 type transport system permease protein
MSRASLMDRALLIVKADFLTWIRYRNAFLGNLVGISIQLATYYYLARAVGPGFRPDGVPYFAFLLIGLGMSGYLLGATSTFVRSVRDAQVSGTFEILMSTPTSGLLVLTLMGFSSFVGQVFSLTVYMIFGFAVAGLSGMHANIAGALLVFGLSMLVTVSLGLIAASVQIVVQKGESILFLISIGGSLLGGAVFPVSALPGWAQQVAHLNPLLYCLDGLRMALLKGATWSELSAPIIGLCVSAIILVPASLATLSASLRRARMQGTLSFF